MKRLRILAAIVFSLAAGCASVQTTSASAQSTVTPEATAAAPATPTAAAPLWRYTLPAGWDQSTVRAGRDIVLTGGRTDVFALDAATGRLRWHNREGSSSALLADSVVVYGTANGSVIARGAISGRRQWLAPRVCMPPPYSSPTGGVDIIVRDRDDLIVGCNGGAISRIDAASGALQRRSTEFSVEQFNSIESIGNCGLALTGWTSGAILVEHVSIVDCRDLHAIVPERNETGVLGAVGNIAILDDFCCFGRPDVYRPATIVHLDIAHAKLSPEVDLTPEPQLYPADKRPIGQGAVAFLSDNHLFLAVDHAIYDYGDARSLPSFETRLQVTLAEPPVILKSGLIAARVRNSDGSVTDEIARIEGGSLRAVWKAPELGFTVFGYDPTTAKDVMTTPAGLVRIDDGAHLVLPPGCRLVASSDEIAVAMCTTKTLVGNRYLEYVAAFHWPSHLAATRDARAGL